MKVTTKFLAQVPMFGGLSPEALGFLIDQADDLAFEPGEHVFREHELGSSLFVLESGRVEVYKERNGQSVRLRVLGPGDVFGEMSFLAVAPRSASIRALKPCHAMRITTDHVHRLYEHDVRQYAMLVMNLAREVCRRLRNADERWARVRAGVEPTPPDGLPPEIPKTRTPDDDSSDELL